MPSSDPILLNYVFGGMSGVLTCLLARGIESKEQVARFYQILGAEVVELATFGNR